MALNYRDIVRKLMIKAENATELGNEAEAQTYAEKAAELATKHGVEAALKEAFEDNPVNIILKRVTLASPYPKHRISLLSVIARNNNCKVLKEGRNVAELFGDEHDVEQVMFLYRLISVHMLGAVSKARPEAPESVYDKHGYFKNGGLTPAEVKSFRISWIVGYINGIAKRMAAARAQAVQESKATQPGAALVLADRKQLVERHVAEIYPRLGKAAPTVIRSRRGYAAGQAASTQADLGQRRVGNRLAIGA
jgi:hypothetical protein